MRIKQTSKSLSRFNTDNSYALKYHNTVVLELNREAATITLRTDGWETMNTAAAMTFGFKELGIDASVDFRKNKKEQGLFLNIEGKRLKIEHGTKVALNPLENLL